MDKTRIYQAAEYMEWMSASPFPAVKQYLLNRGYSVDEINAATKLWTGYRQLKKTMTEPLPP